MTDRLYDRIIGGGFQRLGMDGAQPASDTQRAAMAKALRGAHRVVADGGIEYFYAISDKEEWTFDDIPPLRWTAPAMWVDGKKASCSRSAVFGVNPCRLPEWIGLLARRHPVPVLGDSVGLYLFADVDGFGPVNLGFLALPLEPDGRVSKRVPAPDGLFGMAGDEAIKGRLGVNVALGMVKPLLYAWGTAMKEAVA